MSDELFPAEQVAMDSPKVAWLKKHGLVTEYIGGGNVESPETGDEIPEWVCRLDKPRLSLWNQSEIAGGDTEEEACANLAAAAGLKLWNEEET